MIVAERLQGPAVLETAAIVAERALARLFAAGAVFLLRTQACAQTLVVGAQRRGVEADAALVDR